MSDFDVWIQGVLEEMMGPEGSMNRVIRKVYREAYQHAYETILQEQKEWDANAGRGQGLPSADKKQVKAFLDACCEELRADLPALASALAKWFNDPDRGAAFEPSMHPDLERLASLPPERFEPFIDSERGRNGRFFLTVSIAGPVLHWQAHSTEEQRTFTLDEIEQARKQLADQKVSEMTGRCYSARRMQELEEKTRWDKLRERTKKLAEAFKEKDPYAVDARDRMMHDLINLPDYETWFETHGDERTVKHMVHPLREATVHELYTMFRARLLDELHQAGVIGDDQ